MTTSLNIGYFINQYPAVSHSFIRREILALESLGWRVSRFAIRPARGVFLDAADQAEAEITKFIVKTSATRIHRDHCQAVVRQCRALLPDFGFCVSL